MSLIQDEGARELRQMAYLSRESNEVAASDGSQPKSRLRKTTRNLILDFATSARTGHMTKPGSDTKFQLNGRKLGRKVHADIEAFT
jgi:hypothetical protein